MVITNHVRLIFTIESVFIGLYAPVTVRYRTYNPQRSDYGG